jgi:hypothetical protein
MAVTVVAAFPCGAEHGRVAEVDGAVGRSASPGQVALLIRGWVPDDEAHGSISMAPDVRA